MRTFYDFRSPIWTEPKKYPMQGRVILKWKDKWLLKIYKDGHITDVTPFKNYIVCPKTIYLYDIYIAKSFWDGLKVLFNVKLKN